MGRSWHRRNRERDLHLGAAEAAFLEALDAHFAKMTDDAIDTVEKGTKRLMKSWRKKRGRDRAVLRKMLADI